MHTTRTSACYMKKFFTFFLALAASAETIFAESGNCGLSITWDLTNGVLTISGYGEMYDYDDYKSLSPWYNQRESITSIIINNGVTSIGASAFYKCTGLTSATISDSVTSIGSYAFSGCSKLTSVTIPNSVTIIGERAFSGCCSLTSLTIPTGVTNIGKYAFSGCSGLTLVNWNAKRCASLTERDPIISSYLLNLHGIPENLFFSNNSSIRFFIFGDEVRYIPETLCRGMKNLTTVVIGEKVSNIGVFAFSDCEKLSTVEWNVPTYNETTRNNSYVRTPFYAFVKNGQCDFKNSAPNIKKIIIGPKVTDMANVFYGTNHLTMVVCRKPNPKIAVGTKDFDFTSSITLCVPLEKIELYRSSNFWSKFNPIIPLEAEEDEVNAVTVTPTDNSLVIEWPTIDDAIIYTIEIKKYNQKVCILCFDERGQVLSASYAAPVHNREGKKKSIAVLSETGWRYEFSGLEQGVFYTYTMTALAADNSVLYSSSGDFTTKIETYTITFVNWDDTELQTQEVKMGSIPTYTGETPTRPDDDQYTYQFAMWHPQVVAATADATYKAYYYAKRKGENVEDVNASTTPAKLLHDGQILILRGEKVYTMTGQEVR